MISIEHTHVTGLADAIRGMRNPLASWHRSDSYATYIENPQTLNTAEFNYILGENDLKLAQGLARGGSDHAKYRRMIVVYADITAPLYWWKEYDTYKVGTVANSCSTMHTIHKKEFTLDDFSHEHLIGHEKLVGDNGLPVSVLTTVIQCLNRYRELYLETRDRNTGGR